MVDGVTGDVTWSILKVSGPGDFHLFLTDAFGKPSLVFDGSKGYPQATKVEPNTHAHGNWAFSKAGLYRVQMQMSATSTTGEALTDTQTLVLAVATDAEGIPVGSSSGDGTGSGGENSGDPAASDGTPGSGAAGRRTIGSGSGELPNTGGGLLMPLVGGSVVVLMIGIGLRIMGRRRPLSADAPSGS